MRGPVNTAKQPNPHLQGLGRWWILIGQQPQMSSDRHRQRANPTPAAAGAQAASRHAAGC
eukprot:1159213-Pelagomonas_calceolata.AAC.2